MGVQGKKVRTTSDDVGGKSVGEKRLSPRFAKGVSESENSTGWKSGVIRSSVNTHYQFTH